MSQTGFLSDGGPARIVPSPFMCLFALTGTCHDVEILALDPDEQPAYLHGEAVIQADSR